MNSKCQFMCAYLRSKCEEYFITKGQAQSEIKITFLHYIPFQI